MIKTLSLLLALGAGLSACETPRGAPAAESKSVVNATGTPVEVGKEPKPPAAPVAEAPAAKLTAEDWLALLLEGELLTKSPDEAQARLRRGGELTRLSLRPETLELRSEDARHYLSVKYEKGASASTFEFLGLLLELAPEGAETLESLYASLDEPLRKRFGKPKAVYKSKSGLPQKEYELNKDHLVVLNERQSGDRRVVYVEIAQPQQAD